MPKIQYSRKSCFWATFPNPTGIFFFQDWGVVTKLQMIITDVCWVAFCLNHIWPQIWEFEAQRRLFLMFLGLLSTSQCVNLLFFYLIFSRLWKIMLFYYWDVNFIFQTHFHRFPTVKVGKKDKKRLLSPRHTPYTSINRTCFCDAILAVAVITQRYTMASKIILVPYHCT